MQIRGYELQGEIGRGGLGVVYRGRAPDGRVVAVKVLGNHDAAAVGRFEREARLQAGLGEAEGFVPLEEAGSYGFPFIVMPFVEGGTLRPRLERGPMSVGETLELGRALARALAIAHERGIVHRDLKPENVLFTREGKPLIADLGLAKHFRRDGPDAALSMSVSKSGAFTGTFGYAPFEQTADAKHVGPPADVFALGAILYEALAGIPPFRGETVLELIRRIEDGTVAPLRELRPDAPPGLVRAIEKALSRDAAQRFPDGRAFLSALEETPRRRSPRALVLEVAAVLALIAGIMILFVPRFDTRPILVPPPPSPSPSASVTSVSPIVPSPTPAPSSSVLPRETESFRLSRTTRLRAVLGSWDWKHAGPVNAVAFSQDGRLASGGGDRIVRIRERDAPIASRLLREHTWDVTALAFAPDGRLVSVGRDGLARLWSLDGRDDGKRARLADPLVSVEFLGRSTVSMLGGVPPTRRAWTWNIETGEVQRGKAEDEDVEKKPATRLDEDLDDDHTVLVRGSETYVLDEVLSDASFVFSPSGNRVAILNLPDITVRARKSGELLVYELAAKTGRRIARIELPASKTAHSPFFDFVSEDKVVLVDEHPLLLDVATGATTVLPSSSRPAHKVEISRDRKRIATATAPHNVVDVWNLETAELLSRARGHTGSVVWLDVSADGKRVLSSGNDRCVKLWDVAASREVRSFPTSWACAVGFAGNDAATFVDAFDGNVITADLSGTSPVTTCTSRHDWPPPADVVAGAGTVLVYRRGPAQVVDLRTGSTRRLEVSSEQARTLAKLSGNITLREGNIVVGRGQALFPAPSLIDLETGRRQGDVPVSGTSLCAGAFSRAAVATASPKKPGIVVAELATGGRRVLSGHTHEVAALAFSPDGSVLASTSWDGTIRLWDPGTGASLDTIDLGEIGDIPRAVAFAPDGTFFVGTEAGVILHFGGR